MDYSSFCSKVRFRLPWTSLKYKYEYKIDSAEFYLYQFLCDQTYLVGLNLGLNFKLCEALSFVHGFNFCDNGYAGWNAIKEYFNINNICIDLEKIKLDILKEKIKSIDNIADEEFYGYVEEMFLERPKTREVKLVVEIYRVIKSLQPIKNYDTNLYYELSESAISEIKESSKLTGDIISIDLDKYIPQTMPKFDLELAEDIKKEYYSNVDNIFNEYKTKYPNDGLKEIVYKTINYLINE